MKRYSIALLALLPLLMASCLKDKKVSDRVYGMEGTQDLKIIELASSNDHIRPYAIDFVDSDTTFNVVEVRLAAAQPATEDITVQLTLANSAAIVAAYNDLHETDYEDMPTNLFSLIDPALTVTIPKGSRAGYVKIRVNAATFDPSSTYALGFRIVSVAQSGYVISGNFSDVVVTLGAKNDYDGHYSVTGSMTDANGVYRGVHPTYYDLITVSSNAVLFYQWDFDFANYVVQNISTGGYVNAGVRPRFTFNNATGALVSVVDALTNGNLTMVSGQFHAADRSIDLDYYIIGTRFHIVEHLTYEGPR